MATLRQYNITINPISGVVDAPKKMYFFRTDVETSTLKVVSTEELPDNSSISLTCLKRGSKAIVTMVAQIQADKKTFILGLLPEFTNTSDTLDCELKIRQDNAEKITTFPNFSVVVNPSITDGEEGKQDPVEETTLSNLISEVNSLLDKVGKSRSIVRITKTGTSGLVDTYTIYYSDDTTSTFTVTNGKDGEGGGGSGKSIDRIEKTKTQGLVDTYTIYYTDGSTSTYTIANGQKGQDGEKGDDGNGISRIEKEGTSGLVDTYKIYFTNGDTFTYTVTNGQDGGEGSNPLPTGGTKGQVLGKKSNSDYDVEWVNQEGGGGGDIDIHDPAITGIYPVTYFKDDTSKFATLNADKKFEEKAFPKSSSPSRQYLSVDFTDKSKAISEYDNIYFIFCDLVNEYYNNTVTSPSLQVENERKLYAQFMLRAIVDNGDGTYSVSTSTSKYMTIELCDMPKILSGSSPLRYNFGLQFRYDVTRKMTQLIMLPLECNLEYSPSYSVYASYPVSKTLLWSHKMSGTLDSKDCVGYVPETIKVFLYKADEESGCPFNKLNGASPYFFVRGEIK